MTSVTFAPALQRAEGNSSLARSLRGSRTLFPEITPESSAASPAPLNSAGTSEIGNPSFSVANRVAEPTAATLVRPMFGQHPTARHLARKKVTAFALVKMIQSNLSSDRMARSRSAVSLDSRKRTKGSEATSAPNSSNRARNSFDCSGARVMTMRRPSRVRDLTVFNATPRKLQQTVRAALEQGRGYRAPQLRSILGWPSTVLSDRFGSVCGEHARVNNQAARVRASPDADGNLTSALQSRQHGALGFHCHLRWPMIQLPHRGSNRFLLLPRLDADGALPRRGQADLRRQDLAELLRFSKPVEAGFGEDNRIVIALRQLRQARIHVAAHIHHFEIASIMPQLRLSAQTACADAGAGRQLIELQSATRNQCVACIFPFADRCDLEAREKSCGHVFHAVNRQIDTLFEQRVLDFLGENALAADHAERTLAIAVARGANDDEFGGNSVARKAGAHEFRLPTSQRTAAGPDSKRIQGLP